VAFSSGLPTHDLSLPKQSTALYPEFLVFHLIELASVIEDPVQSRGRTMPYGRVGLRQWSCVCALFWKKWISTLSIY